MRSITKRLLCLTAALLLPLTALCEPVLMKGGYTAWIGDNDWLYLRDSNGGLKYMPSAMADLPAMTDDTIYCLTAAGALWGVKLDGSSSVILAQQAGQSDVDAVTPAPRWENQEGTVTITATGARLEHVLSACEWGDRLFYVSQVGNEAPVLNYTPLTEPLPLLSVPGTPVDLPLTMTATPEAIVLVLESGMIAVADPDTLAVTTLDPGTQVDAAGLVNDQLYCYILQENGAWTFTAQLTLPQDTAGVYTYAAPTATPLPTATPRPTATPKNYISRPTPQPTPTHMPSNTRTTRATATPAPEDDAIHYGDRGTRVKKMQQRLAALGYPVGKVDGKFGKDTLYALNLFQFAIGYTERDYCSAACLSKLNATKAPAYDPYLPIKKGRSGTPVLLMQEALAAKGFLPGKLDGKYGKDTAAALELFQQAMGLPVDGSKATAETLMLLYDFTIPTPGNLG